MHQRGIIKRKFMQTLKLLSLLRPQCCTCLLISRQAERAWCSGKALAQQLLGKRFRTILRKQCQIVIENGRKAQHAPGAVITEHAVVAHVAIGVHDHRVKHQHGTEPLPRLFAKPIEERQRAFQVHPIFLISIKHVGKRHER